MTTLKDLGEQYRTGQIDKPTYILQMHERHRVLFEYADHLETSDIAKIEITDGLVVMTTRAQGITLYVDPDDSRGVPLEILNFGGYEPADLRLVMSLLDDSATVLDIGANIGFYAMSIGKEKPGTHVHAFEPIPKTYRLLERNLSANAVDNVTLYNFALGEKEETQTFWYYPANSGNASAVNVSERDDAVPVECEITTTDAFVHKNGLTVDFVKCDVEGAELFVFRGARQTLAEQKPAVFAELLRKWSAKFGYHPNEVIEFFRELGYRCFTLRGGALRAVPEIDEETVETNFLFLHSDRHRAEIARVVG